MPLYYAETGMGACLRKARTKEEAFRKIISEVGTYNGISTIRLATESDIEWVAAMGGAKE